MRRPPIASKLYCTVCSVIVVRVPTLATRSVVRHRSCRHTSTSAIRVLAVSCYEIQQSPALVATRGKTQLGVECEIAVRLSADLPRRLDAMPYVRSDLAPLISECLATIEIVENRYVDYGRLDAATLIADDFFGAGLILGVADRDLDPNDLDQTAATMLIDGVEVGTGRGSDILGHPLEALAWLANSLNARGSLLRAGEVVTLGSLVATNWVEAGSTVTIVNDSLGEVTVRFVGEGARLRRR